MTQPITIFALLCIIAFYRNRPLNKVSTGSFLEDYMDPFCFSSRPDDPKAAYLKYAKSNFSRKIGDTIIANTNQPPIVKALMDYCGCGLFAALYIEQDLPNETTSLFDVQNATPSPMFDQLLHGMIYRRIAFATNIINIAYEGIIKMQYISSLKQPLKMAETISDYIPVTPIILKGILADQLFEKLPTNDGNTTPQSRNKDNRVIPDYNSRVPSFYNFSYILKYGNPQSNDKFNTNTIERLGKSDAAMVNDLITIGKNAPQEIQKVLPTNIIVIFENNEKDEINEIIKKLELISANGHTDPSLFNACKKHIMNILNLKLQQVPSEDKVEMEEIVGLKSDVYQRLNEDIMLNHVYTIHNLRYIRLPPKGFESLKNRNSQAPFDERANHNLNADLRACREYLAKLFKRPELNKDIVKEFLDGQFNQDEYEYEHIQDEIINTVEQSYNNVSINKITIAKINNEINILMCKYWLDENKTFDDLFGETKINDTELEFISNALNSFSASNDQKDNGLINQSMANESASKNDNNKKESEDLRSKYQSQIKYLGHIMNVYEKYERTNIVVTTVKEIINFGKSEIEKFYENPSNNFNSMANQILIEISIDIKQKINISLSFDNLPPETIKRIKLLKYALTMMFITPISKQLINNMPPKLMPSKLINIKLNPCNDYVDKTSQVIEGCIKRSKSEYTKIDETMVSEQGPNTELILNITIENFNEEKLRKQDKDINYITDFVNDNKGNITKIEKEKNLYTHLVYSYKMEQSNQIPRFYRKAFQMAVDCKWESYSCPNLENGTTNKEYLEHFKLADLKWRSKPDYNLIRPHKRLFINGQSTSCYKSYDQDLSTLYIPYVLVQFAFTGILTTACIPKNQFGTDIPPTYDPRRKDFFGLNQHTTCADFFNSIHTRKKDELLNSIERLSALQYLSESLLNSDKNNGLNDHSETIKLMSSYEEDQQAWEREKERRENDKAEQHEKNTIQNKEHEEAMKKIEEEKTLKLLEIAIEKEKTRKEQEILKEKEAAELKLKKKKIKEEADKIEEIERQNIEKKKIKLLEIAIEKEKTRKEQEILKEKEEAEKKEQKEKTQLEAAKNKEIEKQIKKRKKLELETIVKAIKEKKIEEKRLRLEKEAAELKLKQQKIEKEKKKKGGARMLLTKDEVDKFNNSLKTFISKYQMCYSTKNSNNDIPEHDFTDDHDNYDMVTKYNYLFAFDACAPYPKLKIAAKYETKFPLKCETVIFMLSIYLTRAITNINDNITVKYKYSILNNVRAYKLDEKNILPDYYFYSKFDDNDNILESIIQKNKMNFENKTYYFKENNKIETRNGPFDIPVIGTYQRIACTNSVIILNDVIKMVITDISKRGAAFVHLGNICVLSLNAISEKDPIPEVNVEVNVEFECKNLLFIITIDLESASNGNSTSVTDNDSQTTFNDFVSKKIFSHGCINLYEPKKNPPNTYYISYYGRVVFALTLTIVKRELKYSICVETEYLLKRSAKSYLNCFTFDANGKTQTQIDEEIKMFGNNLLRIIVTLRKYIILNIQSQISSDAIVQALEIHSKTENTEDFELSLKKGSFSLIKLTTSETSALVMIRFTNAPLVEFEISISRSSDYDTRITIRNGLNSKTINVDTFKIDPFSEKFAKENIPKSLTDEINELVLTALDEFITESLNLKAFKSNSSQSTKESQSSQRNFEIFEKIFSDKTNNTLNYPNTKLDLFLETFNKRMNKYDDIFEQIDSKSFNLTNYFETQLMSSSLAIVGLDFILSIFGYQKLTLENNESLYFDKYVEKKQQPKSCLAETAISTTTSQIQFTDVDELYYCSIYKDNMLILSRKGSELKEDLNEVDNQSERRKRVTDLLDVLKKNNNDLADRSDLLPYSSVYVLVNTTQTLQVTAYSMEFFSVQSLNVHFRSTFFIVEIQTIISPLFLMFHTFIKTIDHVTSQLQAYSEEIEDYSGFTPKISFDNLNAKVINVFNTINEKNELKRSLCIKKTNSEPTNFVIDDSINYYLLPEENAITNEIDCPVKAELNLIMTLSYKKLVDTLSQTNTSGTSVISDDLERFILTSNVPTITEEQYDNNPNKDTDSDTLKNGLNYINVKFVIRNLETKRHMKALNEIFTFILKHHLSAITD